jgi:hypothetical protein
MFAELRSEFAKKGVRSASGPEIATQEVEILRGTKEPVSQTSAVSAPVNL